MRLQKFYRGWKVRSFVLPMRKAFGSVKMYKLEAVVLGWITRKIFKLKDVQFRTKLIKDHDIHGLE